MDPIRVAILGCAVKPERFINLLNSYEESRVVVIWDWDQDRGQRVADGLGLPFEADLDRVLSDYRLSGVVILAENLWHKELVLKAASAHLHIFLEKPLCAAQKDAYIMRDAVTAAGVKFFMSDPFVRHGTIQLRQMIADGALGKVTGARFRLGVDRAVRGVSHRQYNKKLSQGGIMAGVGGHMIHVAHYLFGKPLTLFAMHTAHTDEGKAADVEETAVTVMRYGDGKLVTLECSWASGGSSDAVEVFGTEGCVRVTLSGDEPGSETLQFRFGKNNEQIFSPDELPAKPTRHVRYWVEMITKDLPNHIVGEDPLSNSGVSIDNAVEFAEILDAIYRSANVHTEVTLPNSQH